MFLKELTLRASGTKANYIRRRVFITATEILLIMGDDVSNWFGNNLN